jgi:hypothetical protein
MTFGIYNILFIFILGIHLKTIHVNGNINHFCKLENRTIIFNICKVPPRLTIPVCVGSCSSRAQWNFHLNRFVYKTKACTVSQHRTEYFVCPDSTHTAIELMIPLACSCTKHYCHPQRLE